MSPIPTLRFTLYVNPCISKNNLHTSIRPVIVHGKMGVLRPWVENWKKGETYNCFDIPSLGFILCLKVSEINYARADNRPLSKVLLPC